MFSVHAHNERHWSMRAADDLDAVDCAAETAMNEITDALNKLSSVVEHTQADGISEDDFQAARKRIKEDLDELIGGARAQLQRMAEGSAHAIAKARGE